MKKINIPSFAGTVLLMTCLSGAVSAASLEGLQGAWMTSGQDCAATFEKKNGSIQFRDSASSLATGVIIAGDKITGPNGVCTVKRIREDQGSLSLSMSCADAVLASSMSISLRIVDPDTFAVSDFLFPDESQNYHRCSL